MGLNIKNEQTHQLVRELAEITGESMTAAITEAVRERLERKRRESTREVRLARMQELARDMAARIKEPWTSTQIDDLLYDERGLPHGTPR